MKREICGTRQKRQDSNMVISKFLTQFLYMLIAVGSIVLFCFSPTEAMASTQDLDINELLAKSTFYFFGATGFGNQAKAGTVFLISKPIKVRDGNDPVNEKDVFQLVMVTANHVFNDVKVDAGTVVLRESNGSGQWKPWPIQLQIRKGGLPLWTKHPELDIAVIDLATHVSAADWKKIQDLNDNKKDISTLQTMHLATDEDMLAAGITIGSELNCLGFPKNADSGTAGKFPILRGGKIASYPLLPSREIKRFLFDFEVFPGNSGGPVSCKSPYTKLGGGNNVILRSGVVQKIVGLVSEQVYSITPSGAPDADLKLGVVLPATAIKDTVDALPQK